MSNTPQPGRISPPTQLPKTEEGANSANNSPAGSSPRSAPIQKQTKTSSKPVQKKITTLGQVVFIGFAVFVDLLEAFLDLFVIGVVVNRVIDIVVAVIFLLYALAKGLSIANDTKVYGSILGTIAGEFIPGLDIAPFFTIDAWYITHSIKAKDKIRQKAADEQAQAEAQEQQRQDWIENYEQQQAMQTEEEAKQEMVGAN